MRTNNTSPAGAPGDRGRTPWNSIAEGIVDFPDRRLNYGEALASPCETCANSPCCTYVPLQTFNIARLADLDHAAYVLNFEHMLLGLTESGDWGVYYRYPCRFLDRQNFTCAIHEAPTRPQICVQYNPYQCWYKGALTQSASQEFLPIDRQRLEYITSQLVFDEFRNIVELPTWDAMTAAFAALPPLPAPLAAPPAAEDAATAQWKELLRRPGSDGQSSAGAVYRFEDLRDPCAQCEAHCCTTLVFPHTVPASASQLDYYRFCLGFPGIELGIADGAWAVIVRTTCRHLEGHRCAVYGSPERPLICKYYDAAKCTYRLEFGLPRPNGFLRLRFEHFDWLTECFRFDAYGAVLEMPAVEDIRQHVEDRWGETLRAAPAAEARASA